MKDQSETFKLIRTFLLREGLNVERLSGVAIVEVDPEWLLAVNGTRREALVDPPECVEDCCIPARGLAFWYQGLLALELAVPTQGFEFRPVRHLPEADRHARAALKQALREGDAIGVQQ